MASTENAEGKRIRRVTFPLLFVKNRRTPTRRRMAERAEWGFPAHGPPLTLLWIFHFQSVPAPVRTGDRSGEGGEGPARHRRGFRSAAVHRDPARLLLLLLRDDELQHAIFRLRSDVLGVRRVRQREAAEEHAVAALDAAEALGLLGIRGLALAAQREHAVLQ